MVAQALVRVSIAKPVSIPRNLRPVSNVLRPCLVSFDMPFPFPLCAIAAPFCFEAQKRPADKDKRRDDPRRPYP